MDILFLWSFLRVLISIAGAVISDIRPIHILEKSISIWPPSQPFLAWLERVFISPMFRWDANIYSIIASQGFSVNDGTASFHPLYPLVSRMFMILGISNPLSLLLVSNISGLGFLYYFNKLARIDNDQDTTRTSILFLLFSPLAFLLFIPYSEALFLLLSTICLLLCRRQSWFLAGIAGGLATLTRQHGLFLVVPLAWELWQENKDNQYGMLTRWIPWFGILFIPFAYMGLVLYRALFLNDVSLDFSNPFEFIYSILLSPSHTHVVPDFRFLFPWDAISLAITKIQLQPDVDIWTDIVLAAVLLVSAIIAWPKLRTSYRLFVVIIFLVAFSYHTGEVHPYMGLPRHMWLAFPIYIGLGQQIQKPWQKLGLVALGLLLMCILITLYVLEAWVP